MVCTAALSAAVTAVTPATATAQADGQADGGRAWRVVDTRPHPGGDGLLTVAASGRRNVWVFGGADSEDGPTRPVARRWAGGAWHDVALPDEVVGSIDAADASSARNVWAIADHGDVGPSYALRWDGGAWTVSRTWDRRFTTDVVTTGRRNVWVFGYSRAGVGAGTWHFNGKRWRKADLGDLLPERGSAVSARDIWAVGARRLAGCGDRMVAHYDGESWSEVPTGDALPPDVPQPEEGGPYQCVFLRDVLAASSKDVWVVGTVYRSWDDRSEEEPVLAHWDGRTWRREHIPGGWLPRRLASDGRGGLWVAGWSPWDGPTPDATPLMHRAPNGTWRTTPIDAGDRAGRIVELGHVPGTRRVWGVGQVETPDESFDGAIFRYR